MVFCHHCHLQKNLAKQKVYLNEPGKQNRNGRSHGSKKSTHKATFWPAPSFKEETMDISRIWAQGILFLLVFCIYPMLHPWQGYKTHRNDKDPPSTMPQGYWRPLRRLPPISITLLLPTTANGTRSWWRQSTNQNGQTEISQLVGALSPVIFIGLYQGQVKLKQVWKQLFLSLFSFFFFLLLSFRPLMSGCHIRDKLWPMPKHGSMLPYVHRNRKAH